MEILNWRFICEVCQDTIVIPKDKTQGRGTSLVSTYCVRSSAVLLKQTSNSPLRSTFNEIYYQENQALWFKNSDDLTIHILQ